MKPTTGNLLPLDPGRVGQRVYQGVRTPLGCRVRVIGAFQTVGFPLPLRLDLWNHSPTGFEWGYGGSGPAQLALAILADLLGDEQALLWAQEFKRCVVGLISVDQWTMDETFIRAMVEDLKAEHARLYPGREGA